MCVCACVCVCACGGGGVVSECYMGVGECGYAVWV